jgi:hypothetical protein
MFPLYTAVVVAAVGWRGIASRRTLLAMAGLGLLAVPMVVMSLGLAPSNIALVRSNVLQLLTGTRTQSAGAIVWRIVSTHLMWPAMIATVVGTTVAWQRYPWPTAVGLTWIFSVVAGNLVLSGTIEPARYAFGVLPAYYLLAASPSSAASPRAVRIGFSVILAGLLGWQAWSVRYVRPTGAGGYEEAAQYVVQQSREPVVLFHGMADTGYFVFFVRRHDPASRLVVLRGEKLFPGDSLTVDRLYADLQQFGVQFVVVEEREVDTAALRMLHGELKTDRFVERRRAPIVSRQPDARGVDLVVYEYRDARPPDPDAEVDIGVWRANRTIRVPMRDLLAPWSRPK